LLWHWWPGFVWPTKGLWDEIRGKGRKNRRKARTKRKQRKEQEEKTKEMKMPARALAVDKKIERESDRKGRREKALL